jgi:3-phenylpropionate/trans-cinnamate dioxygenase ferredoxin subunit
LALIDVAPVDEFPPGSVKIVRAGSVAVGVFRLPDDRYCAIEDRCSHDDGPLAEGDYDLDEGIVICPRHGSRFDICSGRPLSLPAYEPVDTFPVVIEDGWVKVDVT